MSKPKARAICIAAMLLGAGLVLAGVSLWSPAAAMIIAGVALFVMFAIAFDAIDKPR